MLRNRVTACDISWYLSLMKYAVCCFAVCVKCRILYYLLVRFPVNNVLVCVCAVFLTRSVVILAIFVNIVI